MTRAGIVLVEVSATTPSRGLIGDWSPGIGDPDFMGWFTVAAYLLAFWLCVAAYRNLRRRAHLSSSVRARGLSPPMLSAFAFSLVGSRGRLERLPRELRVQTLWWGLAGMMLFLAVNKQLDLQTALTEIGRMVARRWNLEGVRRQVQVVFIACVVLVSAFVFRAAMRLGRAHGWPAKIALAGMVFLLGFVAVRATSFHHVDELLGFRLAGFKMNWLLELTGIGLVAAGARASTRVPGSGPPPASQPTR